MNGSISWNPIYSEKGKRIIDLTGSCVFERRNCKQIKMAFCKAIFICIAIVLFNLIEILVFLIHEMRSATASSSAVAGNEMNVEMHDASCPATSFRLLKIFMPFAPVFAMTCFPMFVRHLHQMCQDLWITSARNYQNAVLVRPRYVLWSLVTGQGKQ